MPFRIAFWFCFHPTFKAQLNVTCSNIHPNKFTFNVHSWFNTTFNNHFHLQNVKIFPKLIQTKHLSALFLLTYINFWLVFKCYFKPCQYLNHSNLSSVNHNAFIQYQYKYSMYIQSDFYTNPFNECNFHSIPFKTFKYTFNF